MYSYSFNCAKKHLLFLKFIFSSFNKVFGSLYLSLIIRFPYGYREYQLNLSKVFLKLWLNGQMVNYSVMSICQVSVNGRYSFNGQIFQLIVKGQVILWMGKIKSRSKIVHMGSHIFIHWGIMANFTFLFQLHF